MSIRHRTIACAIFRCPLMCAGRTLCQFPIVFEEVGKEIVAPLRWRRGPSDFQAATDGVSAKTFAKFILPPESLILDGGAFWLIAHILRGNGSPVRLAESMSASNECDGFLVIHRHASEGFSDIPRRSDGIGLSIRPFRVHIDQPHLHGSEGILQITIAAVAFVRQPRALRSPINFLFGLPYVRAPAAKTEGLEAHRFERDVARKNHEVSPGDFASILLLDRPEQPACLVKVHVVGPTIERRKALLPGSGPAAAVADAVRSRAVPRHTD